MKVILFEADCTKTLLINNIIRTKLEIQFSFLIADKIFSNSKTFQIPEK